MKQQHMLYAMYGETNFERKDFLSRLEEFKRLYLELPKKGWRPPVVQVRCCEISAMDYLYGQIIENPGRDPYEILNELMDAVDESLSEDDISAYTIELLFPWRNVLENFSLYLEGMR